MKIIGYSLKTYGCEKNTNHLKNWVIEGSQNRSEWKLIDRKENDQFLNGSFNEHYYQVSKPIDHYQYVRIRTIGPNHKNNGYLMLSKIEFYGEIFKA